MAQRFSSITEFIAYVKESSPDSNVMLDLENLYQVYITENNDQKLSNFSRWISFFGKKHLSEAQIVSVKKLIQAQVDRHEDEHYKSKGYIVDEMGYEKP